MPIQVTCPGCLSRFTVSDKYAGKKGPCPKCKKELIVPDKSQEVVIHAPEQSGPKDAKGVSVLKPIRRVDFKLTPLEIIVGVSVLAVSLIGSIVGRVAFQQPPSWFLAIGALLLAPPVAWIGYQLLRDDELEPYNGKEFLQRIGACAGLFPITWGLYWFLSRYLGNKTLAETDGIELTIFIVLMFIAGTVTSLAALELETMQAILHYSLYFGLTFLFAMIIGVELGEPLASGKNQSPYGLPQGNRPPAIAPQNTPATDAASQPAASDS